VRGIILRALACVDLDGAPHRADQCVGIDGLGEEIDRAALHRLHARGHIAVCGHEHHGTLMWLRSICSCSSVRFLRA
jgi:hypothetical protein